MPDFERERRHGGLVAGVDEAGRGPLAGPVVAAAVILDPTVLPRELLAVIDDFKALKAGRREAISIALQERARAGTGVIAAIAAASTPEIETLNILQASLLAMRRAVLRLPLVPDLVLVDGNRLPAGLPCDGETVIGGDAHCLSIAAASILAKVTRDRIMHRLDRRYPGYRWVQNAGYGTADHRNAILELGLTCHHRGSFCRKIFQ